ncbi:hypothetical protein [Streptomyces lycii]|uniref:PD-(D/E)XK endonuclease-like domain-containing protein n=1 Tax=Streptomyces lycii TaxID=2654337 RepID=A0ABQ7FI20_9ACTN|nr:hypothetical protein [Streptomyces lycii]KAF4408639.1 hypothetical protein GCU69_13145 [Streptomyces lycii]
MAKIKTEHKGGSRFYVDTETRVTVPGVTSIIGTLAKPFLAPWNAKLAAEMAVDSLDFLPALVARDRDGAIDLIKGAARRYTSERSKIGSEAHDCFERQIRGEAVGHVAEHLIPYRDHYDAFLQTVQPELLYAEDIAWSDTHEYAGSPDTIVRVKLDPAGKPDQAGDPFTVVLDNKTGKSTYPEVGLQNSAYEHADRLILADGTSVPVPEIDGGMVLHITPDQWSLKPVRTNREDVFATFLHLREIFRWDREISKTVIGKPIAGSSSRLVTGTERRGK